MSSGRLSISKKSPAPDKMAANTTRDGVTTKQLKLNEIEDVNLLRQLVNIVAEILRLQGACCAPTTTVQISLHVKQTEHHATT